MGAINSKKGKKKTVLSEEEYNNIVQLFQTHSRRNSRSMSTDELKEMWGDRLDSFALDLITKYLIRANSKGVVECTTFLNLYSTFVHGDPSDQVYLLWNIFTNRKPNEIAFVQLIEDYGKSIASTFFMIENICENNKLSTWTSKGFTLPENEERKLAKAWFVGFDRHDVCTMDQFSPWFNAHTEFREIHSWVFTRLFCLPEMQVNFKDSTFFPECTGFPENTQFPSILNLARILFLNLALPADLRTEWHFLFSTKVHGESFSKLITNIMGQGPTIIIMMDSNGYIFGGFSAESWILSAKFGGEPSNFLFSIFPNQGIYRTTGYNRNFQYLNYNQKTMPNGLGMGGRLEYFGFWIDAEFGKGYANDTCSTYRLNTRLSKEKNFKLSHLEVWRVGPDPIPSDDDDSDNDRPKRSVLDADPSAKALLDLAGKHQHSEGFREPDAGETSKAASMQA